MNSPRPFDRAVPRDRLGNITSIKRNFRRLYGWPSGRQWKKLRKSINKIVKASTDAQKAQLRKTDDGA